MSENQKVDICLSTAEDTDDGLRDGKRGEEEGKKRE